MYIAPNLSKPALTAASMEFVTYILPSENNMPCMCAFPNGTALAGL